MPKQSGTADLIVKGAIALVTVAFFIGAYLQFQVSFWLALIAALSVYIMLLMVHALMRRSERESELVYEVIASRMKSRDCKLRRTTQAVVGARKDRAPAFAPPPPAGLPPHRRRPLPRSSQERLHRRLLPRRHRRIPRHRLPQMAAAPPRIFRNAPPRSGPEREPSLMALRPGAPAPEPQRSESDRPDPVLSVPTAPFAAEDQQRGPTLPDWSAAAGAPAASADPMHDYWPAPSVEAVAPRGPARRAAADAAAGRRARDRSRRRARHDQASRRRGERRRRADARRDAAARQESALRASLDALQTTANAMRATEEEGRTAAGLGSAARRRADAAADHAVAYAPCFARRGCRRRPHRCGAVADRRSRRSPGALLRGRRLSAR